MDKWEMVRLGDVCDGASSNIAQKDLESNEGIYPIYGASGLIKNVNFYRHDKEYIAVVKDGAGVGRTTILPAKSSVIGTIQAILPKPSVDAKYLYYAIDRMGLAKYYTGATIPHIYFKDYKKELLPLPPLEVQRQIADVLDRASALIEKRKAQIDMLDLLVKSQFIEMFGDPVTNPKGWKTKKLGELCNIFRGGSPRPITNYLGGTVPWIKIGDATKGDDVYLYGTNEKIIEEGISKSRLVKADSLIFANCGVSLGFARIIKFDGCIHDGWLSFENITEQLDKVFLLKSLNMCTDYFRDIAPDGTQPNLNTAIMKAYLQIVPPISIQTRFVKFTHQVEAQKSLLQKSLAKLEQNYKYLMQKCFRGEIF